MLDKLKNNVLNIEEYLFKINRLISDRDDNNFQIKHLKHLIREDKDKYYISPIHETIWTYRETVNRLETRNKGIQEQIDKTWEEIEKMIIEVISSSTNEIENEITKFEGILDKLQRNSGRYPYIKAKSTRVNQIKQYIDNLKNKLETLKSLNYEHHDLVVYYEENVLYKYCYPVIGKLYYLFVYGSTNSTDTEYEAEIEKAANKYLPNVILFNIGNSHKGEYYNAHKWVQGCMPYKDSNVGISVKNKLIDLNLLTEDGFVGEKSINEIHKIHKSVEAANEARVEKQSIEGR